MSTLFGDRLMSISFICLLFAVARDTNYPKPELLIEPIALMRTASMVVLDVRNKEVYGASHVAGAIWVDAKGWAQAFNNETNPDLWANRLSEAGIDSHNPVVVYGDDDVRDVARIWWILRYWGVQDVRLL